MLCKIWLFSFTRLLSIFKLVYINCKVEFYQPSCWLYSVLNLFVFQQLVTLYLGRILVRVVSEIVWRNAQECARKTGTRGWISQVTRGCKPPEAAHVPGMLEVEASRQLEHYRTKLDNWPFSYLAIGTHDSVKPRATLFWKTWLFTFHSHPNINTPFTHEKKRASRENFKRETLEKNKIDTSTIFIKRLFKFFNSLPLHY